MQVDQEVEKGHVLSVSQLTALLKQSLEKHFPFVQVCGEISNLRSSSSHLYFTLKDANAQISIVAFRYERTQNPPIKDGDEVVIKGRLSLYEKRGSYQIIAQAIEFKGLGNLLLELHHLKEKLASLGWFNASHKKPLPKYPKTLGVVTSPTGAVIFDILTVLKRRMPGFHLILNPVKVQGIGAANEIAQAIEFFNSHSLVDLIIVGRGGGSLEDLWAFNEEKVVHAIHKSTIPVISAVGHESDFTLTDYVADVRAPTPSAAAEMATKEYLSELQSLKNAKKRLHAAIEQNIGQKKLHLNHLLLQLKAAEHLLGPFWQQIDEIAEQITMAVKGYLNERRLTLQAQMRECRAHNPIRSLQMAKKQLMQWRFRLQRVVNAYLSYKQTLWDIPKLYNLLDTQIHTLVEQKKGQLCKTIAHLRSISPQNILKKGYCIPFDENSRSVIMAAKDISSKQSLSLLFHDGEAKVQAR